MCWWVWADGEHANRFLGVAGQLGANRHILPHSAGEDDDVHSVHSRGVSADILLDTVTVNIESGGNLLVVLVENLVLYLTHIVAILRESQDTAFLVEGVLHLCYAHSHVLDHIQRIAGSRSPLLVPISTPAKGVKPIEVSTDLPWFMAVDRSSVADVTGNYLHRAQHPSLVFGDSAGYELVASAVKAVFPDFVLGVIFERKPIEVKLCWA